MTETNCKIPCNTVFIYLPTASQHALILTYVVLTFLSLRVWMCLIVSLANQFHDVFFLLFQHVRRGCPTCFDRSCLCYVVSCCILDMGIWWHLRFARVTCIVCIARICLKPDQPHWLGREWFVPGVYAACFEWQLPTGPGHCQTLACQSERGVQTDS